MDKLLTTKDIMDRWQCTEATVRKQIIKGLKVIKLGNKDFRYSFDDVRDFENQLKQGNKKTSIDRLIRINNSNNKKCEVI